MGELGLYDSDGHLLGNLQPITFERHHLAWVVRQDADRAEAQINQNLRADAALALHHALPAEVSTACASCCSAARCPSWRVRASRSSTKTPTASPSPSTTCSCAARANCSARARAACPCCALPISKDR